jgi:regulatory protein
LAELSQAALDAALKLLAIRSRSRHELRMALARKGFAEAQQDAVLEKLASLGYVDDARFARDRAAALLRNGRLGPRAVMQRLRGHGLAEEEARTALADAEAALGTNASETARLVLAKKGYAGRPLSASEKGKAARLLQARGFSESTIEQLLGESSLDLGTQDG